MNDKTSSKFLNMGGGSLFSDTFLVIYGATGLTGGGGLFFTLFTALFILAFFLNSFSYFSCSYFSYSSCNSNLCRSSSICTEVFLKSSILYVLVFLLLLDSRANSC